MSLLFAGSGQAPEDAAQRIVLGMGGAVARQGDAADHLIQGADEQLTCVGVCFWRYSPRPVRRASWSAR